MKQIVNVKRIFISEDFNKLVELLKSIKADFDSKFISYCDDVEYHDKDLQIIGHRIYTHPQNPTLNVLEIDYVNKVDTSTETEDVESASNVLASGNDSK